MPSSVSSCHKGGGKLEACSFVASLDARNKEFHDDERAFMQVHTISTATRCFRNGLVYSGKPNEN